MTAADPSGRRILVMEDNGLVAMLISELLDRLGHVVIGPHPSVQSALNALENEAIDLALLDINLGNGETSYPIAEILSRRGVPFAFLTGYDQAGLSREFRDRPVISKPIDQANLSQTLRKLSPISRDGSSHRDRSAAAL